MQECPHLGHIFLENRPLHSWQDLRKMTLMAKEPGALEIWAAPLAAGRNVRLNRRRSIQVSELVLNEIIHEPAEALPWFSGQISQDMCPMEVLDSCTVHEHDRKIGKAMIWTRTLCSLGTDNLKRSHSGSSWLWLVISEFADVQAHTGRKLWEFPFPDRYELLSVYGETSNKAVIVAGALKAENTNSGWRHQSWIAITLIIQPMDLRSGWHCNDIYRVDAFCVAWKADDLPPLPIVHDLGRHSRTEERSLGNQVSWLGCWCDMESAWAAG